MKGLVYETSVLDPDEVSTHTHKSCVVNPVLLKCSLNQVILI